MHMQQYLFRKVLNFFGGSNKTINFRGLRFFDQLLKKKKNLYEEYLQKKIEG